MTILPPTTALMPLWNTYRGRRVTLRAREGSYAARRAGAEVREADRAVTALEKLLDPADDKSNDPIVLLLCDPLDSPPEDVLAGAILRIVSPDSLGVPVAQPLARLLLGRWFGIGAADCPLLVIGLAGLASARAKIGRSVSECQEWARAELAAGRKLSILPFLAPQSSGADEDDRAATAFLAYLAETHGLPALRRFVAAFEAGRPDQAAVSVYQQPLGVLDQNWRLSLKRSGDSRAIQAFFRRLWPLLKPYRWRQAEIVCYMLFGLGVTLALPLSTQYLTDHVYNSPAPRGDRLHKLALIAGVLLVVYIANALITMRRAFVTTWVNQQVVRKLRERMFGHLQHLSHNYYAEAKIGDIMSRLLNDLGTVQQSMVQVTDTGIYQALIATGAAIALLRLDWRLALLVLLIVPLFAVSFFGLQSRLQKASGDQQKRMGETSVSIQETLAAQAAIKAFGLEERTLSAYKVRLSAQIAAGLRLVVIGALANLSVTLAVAVAQIVVLGVGGYLVVTGQITIGTLFAFSGLLMALLGPIAGLSGVGQTLQLATGSMDRVTELLDEPITVADKPGALDLGPLSKEIKLEDIQFGYGGENPILRGLNLSIPAGSNVAFVGPSGCGKSTAINLLMRFWDPEEGRVLFDGQDLQDVTLQSLRGQIGLVFQDTFIFDTTLRENIAIARPLASEAEILEAARSAQLESYIASLPNGMDTVLGERGTRMSGGQRQRLAIARVVLRDPRILILDEATSALDSHTEADILTALSKLTQGRTTISVTHRLSWAVAADCVYVLDKGRVVEQGPHAELVTAGGLYQRLYEEQSGGVTGAKSQAEQDFKALRAIPLFAGLSEDDLRAVSEKFLSERFAAGADIVLQGEPGDKLYLIAEGQVEVLRSEGERVQRLSMLSAGEYFGEMALIADQPRAATVRAVQTTRLRSLGRPDFAALLASQPALKAAIEQTVAARQAMILGI